MRSLLLSVVAWAVRRGALRPLEWPAWGISVAVAWAIWPGAAWVAADTWVAALPEALGCIWAVVLVEGTAGAADIVNIQD